MKKFTMLAVVSLLMIIGGNAVAEQSLTDTQMDGISAGYLSASGATATSNAYSSGVAITYTRTESIAHIYGASAFGNASGLAYGYRSSASSITQSAAIVF